ncbi:MAG: hypothetical protein K8Q99_03660 [Acholeplasmataceae bacterium]|nr:hypothetical protein [Acholeplasmataceae bacterium]
MKRKTVEKDPFAEYDKFWDELDEAEDIKNDEDYFKDKPSYTRKPHYQSHKNQLNKMIGGFSIGAIIFMVFGFMILVRFTGRLTMGRLLFVLPSFIFFGIFMSVLIFMLSKLKKQ